MKLSFNTNAFCGEAARDISEIADVAAKAGLDALEINAEPFPVADVGSVAKGLSHLALRGRHAGLDIPDDAVRRAREACDRRGLKVSAVCAHLSLLMDNEADRQRNLADYRKCIDHAVLLGTSFVHGFSGAPMSPVLDPREEERLWELFRKGCVEVLDYAGERGVDFGIETVIHFLVHDCESIRRMFEVVNRDDLFLNFDPGQAYARGGQDEIMATLREFGSKIRHVHIKDCRQCPPFSWERFKRTLEYDWSAFDAFPCGDINWQALLRELKRQGYDGFLSWEYRPGNYLPKWERLLDYAMHSYVRDMRAMIGSVS